MAQAAQTQPRRDSKLDKQFAAGNGQASTKGSSSSNEVPDNDDLDNNEASIKSGSPSNQAQASESSNIRAHPVVEDENTLLGYEFDHLDTKQPVYSGDRGRELPKGLHDPVKGYNTWKIPKTLCANADVSWNRDGQVDIEDEMATSDEEDDIASRVGGSVGGLGKRKRGENGQFGVSAQCS